MPQTLRSSALAIIAILSLATVVACGEGGPSSSVGQGRQEQDTTGSGSREKTDENSQDRSAKHDAEEIRVTVVDTAFKPAQVSVAVGSKLVWKQSGKQPHSVTATQDEFDSSPDCSPLEIASCLHEGSSFSHTFDKPGTYRYYCRVHGLPDGTGMVGAVRVHRL